MRRALKISAWAGLCVVGLIVLAVLGVLAAGNTDAGRAMIERVTFRLTGGMVRLSGLGGAFPARLTLRELELTDPRGVWLSAEGIELAWSPLKLLERRIAVDDVHAARLDMERRPEYKGGGGTVSVPHIDVARFAVDRVDLGAELAGTAAALSVTGGMQMRSLEDARADLLARRIDNAGEYTLHLRFDPRRMDGTLTVHEPASGPLENILQVPGLGALNAHLDVRGPRNAERIELALSAGDATVRVRGSVDLERGATDLHYALDSPSLSPRPDLHWRRLSLQGDWQGTFKEPTAHGELQAVALQIPGGIDVASLQAHLEAAGGTVSVRGVVGGLRIPGPQAALFEKDPVTVDASMRVGAEGRPLAVAASSRLLSLKGQAITAGQQSASLEVRVPDLAPFAAIAGQDVRGDGLIKARVDRRGANLDMMLDANAVIAGGREAWIDIVGNRVGLSFAGSMSDAAFTIDRATLEGRSLVVSAKGTAQRVEPGSQGTGAPPAAGGSLAPYIRHLKAQWDLRVADLGIVAPILAGSLQASGGLDGAPASLSVDANVKSTLSIRGSSPGSVSGELRMRGFPSSPSAEANLKGTVDGSPLDLEASLDRLGRTGMHARIQRGDWKSVHAEGELSYESSLADARGHMRVEIGRLGDLDRLLGSNLQGSLDGAVTFTPMDGHTRAKFDLDGKDLVAGRISGSLQVSGEGDTTSVAARLRAQSPGVGGAPADLSAEGAVDLDRRQVRLNSASADYRGQTIRLLGPATLSYAGGLRLDELKLGVQDAVLEVHGALSPALDLTASLQHIGPKVIDAYLPDVVSQGSIEGTARLEGSLSAPTGTVRLNAHDIRFATDQAVGLPALNLTANADLKGNEAALDIQLKAGSASLFKVTGEAPLNSDGAYELKMNGKLDLAVVNPFFEARGLHAGGDLTADASLGGKLDAPQIRGSIKIAGGNFRDYVRGLNLTDLTAEVDGSEGSLEIKDFSAKAASGSISMTGSIGALQPGIPVTLKISASKAQLLNSQIVTANVSGDLDVTGHATERLAVGGTIRVNRALIGIPDSLPPDVAVLDVRRRGQHVPAAAAKPLQIGLDITVDAPREILVQGRGLDAELGGDLRIRGTAQAPQVSGGFNLLRGTFSLAGSTLTFDKDNSRLSFDGVGLKKNNIDPTLDFNATTTVQNTTVKLRIYGYADSPKFEFSSPTNSGLSQDEIMALLLFGEPASQLSAIQLAQVGAALATLSGVGGSGGNPLTKLQRTLGLDRLSVGANTVTTPTGATENSGAAIQAGRYITRRVYVEGKQSTTGTSQVQVDVDLTKHLKLQTRLGNGTAIQGTTPENDPGSSIGLSYQIEY